MRSASRRQCAQIRDASDYVDEVLSGPRRAGRHQWRGGNAAAMVGGREQDALYDEAVKIGSPSASPPSYVQRR